MSKNRIVQFNTLVLAVLMLAVSFGLLLAANAAELRSVNHVTIVTETDSPSPVQKAAEILAKRIMKRSSVTVDTAKLGEPQARDIIDKSDLAIMIGLPDRSRRTRRFMERLGMRLPTLPNSDKIHPETPGILFSGP